MLPSGRRAFLKSSAGAATVGLTGLAGCVGGGGDSETPTIGFNYVVPIENLGSLLDVPEIQEQLNGIGEDYELDVSHDSSTPDSLNALAAGQSDMCLVTTVSYGNAVTQEAVPGNVSMVATDFWDAHPDHYGITVFSGPDSDITEPEDLEGATLGVNALGTGIHAVYRKQLRELGLVEGEDVEFVEQGFPTFNEAIQDGIFDVGVYPAFFAVGARHDDFTKVYSSQDVWDQEYPFAYVVAANDSLDEKGDAIESLMADYTELVDYLFENRDEVVSQAATHFEIPEEVVDEFFLTQEYDYYRDDVEIDMDRLQFIMDDMYELDFIDEQFDVQEYATNEYLP